MLWVRKLEGTPQTETPKVAYRKRESSVTSLKQTNKQHVVIYVVIYLVIRICNTARKADFSIILTRIKGRNRYLFIQVII